MSQNSFLNWLLETFPDRLARNCLESSQATYLCVYESDTKKARLKVIGSLDMMIENQSIVSGFLIENPSRKSIHLLALDDCFFQSDEAQRCDSLVFDDLCLCFVELKLEVHRRKATDQLKVARRQLGATIKFFREVLPSEAKNFYGFRLEAYVVMRANVYPKRRASRAIIFTEFLEKFEVRLFEENKKLF